MIDISDFKNDHPQVKVIEVLGQTDRLIEIIQSIKNDEYFAKGPFGTNSEYVYISLGFDLSTESKQTLLAQWRRNF
jgi:hypothetical protein